ncbi:putative S-adenosyl-L-methionine-dependent methyltransferase [Tetrabaena socialis]|uniref:Putative S-adenosyl-L-methionine-dependent methyltransferase n=1 Tax=Tetrabaena socialis TaxID=47790 RepID=A0A2J8AAI4_9CHLO|nr:putative S-adenosyl-L-methionine-dependent methyltransferase [Tetrabaena socialis]|eukprot:PNH09534.1 putative S-adenosyl-L-methionine-dependent methyltransferase [Tetrabaena socialis]
MPGDKSGHDGASPLPASNVPAAKGSSKLGLFYHVTRGQPTNYDMLVFRTLNRDMGLPNANQDYLASSLQRELMPVRSWMLRTLPGSKTRLKSTLENSLWGVPGAVNFIDARTKWFDGAVQDAVAAGIKQVVQLAVGYDTRAYRLHAPGVRFFEVDLPSASGIKQRLVEKLGWITSPAMRPTYVGADLSRVPLAEALAGTGFDPTQPALFTVEGLIYYLPKEACAALFAAISDYSAPGSRLYFDFMATAALEGRGSFPGFKVTQKAVSNKHEPFLSGIEATREGISAYVNSFGLQLLEFLSPKDMVGRMLPHLQWSDRKPPIASFYNYAAAVKP